VGDCNSYSNSNANSHGYSYANGNLNTYPNNRTKTYTDAQAAPDAGTAPIASFSQHSAITTLCNRSCISITLPAAS
jgi:hypothetical protein